MCGVAGIFGPGASAERLERMVAVQGHRGPDSTGFYEDPDGGAFLGHSRLSIIDLSAAGDQPMRLVDRPLWLAFNGEIYNYLELAVELHDYRYRSRSDTEVALAAYDRWSSACLDRFIGMFAMLYWDEQSKSLFAARDRFGVKPLYYHQEADGTLLVASEIKALFAAGVRAEPNERTWATYFASGRTDHSSETFWRGVYSVPPGHSVGWTPSGLTIQCWYDLARASEQKFDSRPIEIVEEEYRALLSQSVALRFRSDVPVGINLSGGLDSSVLLGFVHEIQGEGSDAKAFTFVCEDPRYDEFPWVCRMLERSNHDLVVATLRAEDVPDLAVSVQRAQDEPFGGIPTLAYARLFEVARRHGVTVLLDGQGMDEQWAGYDYYRSSGSGTTAIVQGTSESPVRPECLVPEFRMLEEEFEPARPFPDALRSLQYRDARYTKIPRALRFNDRISMRVSTELREPFLDHRLFELALRQPRRRKIDGETSKVLLRRLAAHVVPSRVVEAPKRPVQTPQREWLRGPLAGWAESCIDSALEHRGGSWFHTDSVRREWDRFASGAYDNSFFVWQWIGAGLLLSDADMPWSSAAPRVPSTAWTTRNCAD